jgi:hypothetical protein
MRHARPVHLAVVHTAESAARAKEAEARSGAHTNATIRGSARSSSKERCDSSPSSTRQLKKQELKPEFDATSKPRTNQDNEANKRMRNKEYRKKRRIALANRLEILSKKKNKLIDSK